MNLDQERQAIRDELETLRANGARRQELSLHACKRLFFDLGIRPSMAAVRDLTQTGSASDIPKDIDQFLGTHPECVAGESRHWRHS